MSISSVRIDGNEGNEHSTSIVENLLILLETIGIGFEIRYLQTTNKIIFCEATLIGSSFDAIFSKIEKLSAIELESIVNYCFEEIRIDREAIDDLSFAERVSQSMRAILFTLFDVQPKSRNVSRSDPIINLHKRIAIISLLQKLANVALEIQEKEMSSI